MERESKKILEMVFDLIMSFTKILQTCKEAENLKTMELYILMYVGMKSSKKMSELAKVFSKAKSNMTVLIDGMEEKGYIKRIHSKSDRRVITIDLTKKGEEVFNSIVKNFERLIESVMKKIPQKDLSVISDGFFRMIEIFTDYPIELHRKEGGKF